MRRRREGGRGDKGRGSRKEGVVRILHIRTILFLDAVKLTFGSLPVKHKESRIISRHGYSSTWIKANVKM